MGPRAGGGHSTLTMDIARIDLSTLEVGDVLRYTSRVRDIEDPRTLPTSKMPGLLVLTQKLLGCDAAALTTTRVRMPAPGLPV